MRYFSNVFEDISLSHKYSDKPAIDDYAVKHLQSRPAHRIANSQGYVSFQ